MNLIDQLIRDHFNASARLVQQAISDALRETPDDLAAVRQALKAGAMLTLHSTLAPAAGLARLVIEVTEPSGKTHSLMSVDLQRETQQ